LRRWNPTTLLDPGPSSGLVDCLVGRFFEVQWIDALANVGRFLGGGLLRDEPHIEADGFEFRDSLGARLIEKGHEGGGVLSLIGPDSPAVLIVIGDDGEIAVTLAIRDLVDSNAG